MVLALLTFCARPALAQVTSGTCPKSTTPQNQRTITFVNSGNFNVWLGGEGAGVPSELISPPGLLLHAGGSQSYCVPSPCLSCSYSPATNCSTSSSPVSCVTGYTSANGFRSAPVTVAEIAQGGTQNAAVLQTGAQTGLANQFIGHAWLKPGSITITDTAKTISATDDGKGGFTGSGFSSGSVDYTTGNVTLVYNSTTSS